jgi:hypothetical protein
MLYRHEKQLMNSKGGRQGDSKPECYHPHLSPDADFVVENIKTACQRAGKPRRFAPRSDDN